MNYNEMEVLIQLIPAQKTCTIRCDYSEVSELTTPLGDIEITRRDAYQQFKWSKSKGTYGIKGGYV